MILPLEKHSIIEIMRFEDRNFMEIITDKNYGFPEWIDEQNLGADKKQSLESMVDELHVSPKVKRGIIHPFDSLMISLRPLERSHREYS